MDKELARCKDFAARARELAKSAYRANDKHALLSIAENYERLAAEIEAKNEVGANQAS